MEERNKLHRICLRLTRTYGALFGHLDKATSDARVAGGSRPERGLAKFMEWTNFGDYKPPPRDPDERAKERKERIRRATELSRQQQREEQRAKLAPAATERQQPNQGLTITLTKTDETKGTPEMSDLEQLDEGFAAMREGLGQPDLGDLRSIVGFSRARQIPKLGAAKTGRER